MRVEGVELVGADGQPRDRFVSGEPVVIRLRLVGERPCRRRCSRSRCETPSGSLLGATSATSASSAGTERRASASFAFSLDRLPLGEGEFQLSVALTDAAGTRRYHRVDGAERFEVEPADHARGAVRLEGEWALTDAEHKVEAS